MLDVVSLSKDYGNGKGCREISLDLRQGEVLGVVGESGSGKTTLLNCLAGRMTPDGGAIRYNGRDALAIGEPERRALMRSEWAYVHQNPADGLRMGVSAGGNIAERLMETGARRYGAIREEAARWLQTVEIGEERIDDRPSAFSGGMRQRLQIARALAGGPKIVFMDEPTGGLDVSVQARLLDLIRRLVAEFGLSVVLVTHDLAVARLLSDRLIVMKDGRAVEAGLTDQVLDDPQAPYTQLLVSAILQV